MSIEFTRYNEFLNRVIEWNRVAKGGFKNDEANLKLQKSVTSEELIETKTAIAESDKKETLDGIADVFVTAGFLNYMMTEDFPVKIYSIRNAKLLYIPGLIDMMDYDMAHNHVPSHFDIQKLYAWASEKWSEEEVVDYFERVLASNESKFVPADEWNDKELEVATEKYRDKGFTDIVAVDAVFNGTPVKVLRADNGNGKILKPSTFIEP